jgi:hypothetical protein
MQYGVGPELAAQCQTAALPDGWRPWTDLDGPIPDALSNRAQTIVQNSTAPLGVVESYPLPGVTALIRVETHVWGRDTTGALVQGCFRAAGVYLPAESPLEKVTPPSDDSSRLSKTVGILTAASLLIGIVGAVAKWKIR